MKSTNSIITTLVTFAIILAGFCVMMALFKIDNFGGGMFAIFLSIILGFIGASITSKYINKIDEEEINKTISEMESEGTTITKKYGDLVIDQINKKWGVIKNPSMPPYMHNFSDLVSFRLVENGVEYENKGGVMRAAVGGALFGTAGAIIGASTANQRQNISEIYVLAVTSNFDHPTEKIQICSSVSDTSSLLYRSYIDTANKIVGLLTAIQANS